MTELPNQLEDLKLELEKKENEIIGLNKKVQNLEDELLKFHEIISEGISLKKIEEVIESKYEFDLKSKEDEIRNLKNKMGFLRKEKMGLIRELEAYKQKGEKSSVLRVEDIRFEKSLEAKEKHIKELEESLNERDKKIDYLNSLVSKLKEKQISQYKDNLHQNDIYNKSKNISKEEYKKKIRKYKDKIKKLTNKLSEFEKSEKEKIKTEIDILDLKNTIPRLQKEIEKKDLRIKELETMFSISSSKK